MSLSYSCQKVAELLSQSLDEPLDFTDKVRLKIHLAMCGNCSNVEQQLNTLHALIPDIGMYEIDEDQEESDKPSRHFY